MKAGLLIRPQITYLLKAGFKFLFIPLLFAVIVGLFGFKSITLNHNNSPYVNSNYNNAGIFAPINNLFIDSTKKSKADSIKKTFADTTKKKEQKTEPGKLVTAITDSTKKEFADSTKKNTRNADLNKSVEIKADTTKKAVQNSDVVNPVVAKTDTTKKDTISPDVKYLLH